MTWNNPEQDIQRMHKRHWYVVWSLVIWVGIAAAGYAEAPPLMTVDEIRPGMRGIGKTVFSGTTIEEFDVKILAVLKNESQYGDVILAEVSGSSIALEEVGVVAGMSGSPIYIDGKLIGALAFTQAFAKAPMIGGITPIHEMLADAQRDASGKRAVALPDRQTTPVVAIQTPVMLSGIDPRILPFVQTQLASYAMTPVQSGNMAHGSDAPPPPELEPGSAIGIQLIRGDMNATAVGTVTYRADDLVLAFGHPMFSLGEVELPMTAAHVHFVWATHIISSKMASALHTVGAITRDYRTGISGRLGAAPAMIPLAVTMKEPHTQEIVRQYNVEVIDHPLLTATLAMVAGVNGLYASEALIGAATVRTRLTLTLRDYPPVIVDNISTGIQDVSAPVAKAFAPLQVLLNNTFTPVAIQRIALEISVEHLTRTAEIIGARIDRNIVHPGQVVETAIFLRPYGAEETHITTAITIPEELQEERIVLLICDQKNTMALEAARAGGKFQPQSVNQLIDLLNQQVSPDHLALSLFQIRPGVVVQGRELPAPPLSMMTLLGSATRYTGETSLTRGRILLRQDLPTGAVVSGCAALELIVDRSGKRFDGAVAEAVVLPQEERVIP